MSEHVLIKIDTIAVDKPNVDGKPVKFRWACSCGDIGILVSREDWARGAHAWHVLVPAAGKEL